MKIVILAGGSGTRLWPWSRESKPKQTLYLFGLGDKTLLQETYSRLRKHFPARDIYVSTHRKYARLLKAQLPGLSKRNLLLESEKKGSAGAIGLAAAGFYARNPKEIMITVHSDHWLEDGRKLARVLATAEKFLRRYPQKTFLAGLKPQYAETGYGYIKAGKKFVQIGGAALYEAEKFLEKPSLAKAKRFARQKNYFWNPGWFGWRVDHLLELFARHSPENYKILQKLSRLPASVGPKRRDIIFSQFKEGAIEKMILERDRQQAVLPAQMSWTDIGHWRSVAEMAPKDQDGNAANSDCLLLDSRRNLLLSESGKLIAAVGIEDFGMIETKDVILLIKLGSAQRVRELIKLAKTKKSYGKYL